MTRKETVITIIILSLLLLLLLLSLSLHLLLVLLHPLHSLLNSINHVAFHQYLHQNLHYTHTTRYTHTCFPTNRSHKPLILSIPTIKLLTTPPSCTHLFSPPILPPTCLFDDPNHHPSMIILPSTLIPIHLPSPLSPPFCWLLSGVAESLKTLLHSREENL